MTKGYEPTQQDLDAAVKVLMKWAYRKPGIATSNVRQVAMEMLQATDPLRPHPVPKHLYPMVLYFRTHEDGEEFSEAMKEANMFNVVDLPKAH